ncbi:MAG: hypothetical protein Q9188_007518 [Gyalolechia gomerana]
MRLLNFLLLPLLPFALAAEVNIEYTLTNECSRKSQRGDTVQVHYRGTLESDGKEFDASYNRGQPLEFTVGKGMVIKGSKAKGKPEKAFVRSLTDHWALHRWDENLLGMCIGDKRKLTIPPEFGYGQRAMGAIPAGSTLVFETELMGIQGVEKDEL